MAKMYSKVDFCKIDADFWKHLWEGKMRLSTSFSLSPSLYFPTREKKIGPLFFFIELKKSEAEEGKSFVTAGNTYSTFAASLSI